MKSYDEVLTRVIDDGVAAAKRDYGEDGMKSRGAVAGFEACRGKTPDELRDLLGATAVSTRETRRRDDYWWYRCYEAEVEWVCNVISAVLQNAGQPTIVTPTARGVMKAAEILGVAAS